MTDIRSMLRQAQHDNLEYMKILVFTEGTILKHSADDKKEDFKSYVLIKDAVKKVNNWVENGAEVEYLTSRKKFLEIKQITDVLKDSGLPGINKVHARQGDEEYKEVVERIKPNILIEDDCASIGGENELASLKLDSELKIKVIVVPEFGGIDELPDDLDDLKIFGDEEEVNVEE